jgi:hypothetical protein
MKTFGYIALALIAIGAVYFFIRTSNSKVVTGIISIFSRGPKDPYQ